MDKEENPPVGVASIDAEPNGQEWVQCPGQCSKHEAGLKMEAFIS
ncbi:uncharacterized protein J3R85_007580 [Psidium guajava]|nr:uncharacterized protein J3R85_007580 [Psidium guajava]